ncbi:MAG: AMP-binding protein [Calditrichae bacterium]|nr:AMP-binding protein [Calditrichia bacterium]
MNPPRILRRSEIVRRQLAGINRLMGVLLPDNRFYREKYRRAGVSIPPVFNDLDEFSSALPFTTKQELAADQHRHPPYGSNLTFELSRYTRFHQTSATSGDPIRWLDTSESWSWMLDNWEIIFRNAGVADGARIYFAFSFGPFLGFWTAFEAATRMGCLAIPGGGLSSLARLRMILDNEVAVLCCTPTYAIRLGELAREEALDLSAGRVRAIIVAGEPGGSIPAIYRHIERLWPGARVYDHHGMTEVGPVSYEDPETRGTLRIIETAYYPEIIDPQSGMPVAPGTVGELVLTTLGRSGSPLIRYRTGDLVKQKLIDSADHAVNQELALEGGILGRTDDMISVRGVNLYPGMIDEIVRTLHEVAEYQVEIFSRRGMEEMRLRIEPVPACPDPRQLQQGLEKALRASLALRVPVELADPGTLPRFEMKAKRWIRR